MIRHSYEYSFKTQTHNARKVHQFLSLCKRHYEKLHLGKWQIFGGVTDVNKIEMKQETNIANISPLQASMYFHRSTLSLRNNTYIVILVAFANMLQLAVKK